MISKNSFLENLKFVIKKLVKSPVVIVLAFVVVVVVVEEVGCEAAGVMDALLLEDVDWDVTCKNENPKLMMDHLRKLRDPIK